MPKAKKRRTNMQLVVRLMSVSQYGDLSQLFIMNAIKSAADVTAEIDPATLPKNSFAAPEAWVGVAKEIKAAIDDNWSE